MTLPRVDTFQRFGNSIETLGLGSFIGIPPRFCYELVREFYSVLHTAVGDAVMLFGKPFSFSSESIRAIHRVPQVSRADDLFFKFENNMLTYPTHAEIVYTLTLGVEPKWNRPSSYNFQCGFLCPEARLWWLLL